MNSLQASSTCSSAILIFTNYCSLLQVCSSLENSHPATTNYGSTLVALSRPFERSLLQCVIPSLLSCRPLLWSFGTGIALCPLAHTSLVHAPIPKLINFASEKFMVPCFPSLELGFYACLLAYYSLSTFSEVLRIHSWITMLCCNGRTGSTVGVLWQTYVLSGCCWLCCFDHT